LWEKDLVEMFIGSELNHANRYKEFQVAPTGGRLDLALELPHRNFEWFCGWESAVHVDESRNTWTCEMKTPLSAIADGLHSEAPAVGVR